MSNRQPFTVETHDGTGLDDFCGRLKFAAATKLQPWYEIQEAPGLHYIRIGEFGVFIADRDTMSAYQCISQVSIINREVDEMEEKRIVGAIDYPRLCKKTIVAKHLA
jgi:hypothetical protein